MKKCVFKMMLQYTPDTSDMANMANMKNIENMTNMKKISKIPTYTELTSSPNEFGYYSGDLDPIPEFCVKNLTEVTLGIVEKMTKKMRNWFESTPIEKAIYEPIVKRLEDLKVLRPPVIRERFDSRYFVMNMIAEGAFSTVCKVFDEKEKKEYAFKVVKLVDYYCIAAEYLVMSLFKDNPLLMSYKEVFLVSKCIVYKMELMTASLSTYMAKTNGNTLRKNAKFILREIARAIKTLHDAGFYHSDIKPANILLKTDIYGNIDRVCVTDFNSVCTSFHQGFGTTISYRSPEAHYFHYYSDKNDVYSIGCIMYELLTKTVFNFSKKDTTEEYEKFLKETYNTDLSLKDERFVYFSPDEYCLLDMLLKYDSNKRFSIDMLLENSYLN